MYIANFYIYVYIYIYILSGNQAMAMKLVGF